MQKQSLKKVANEFLPSRYTQISESHCGPAVVQMLLAHLGLIFTQEKIAEAGGALKTIETLGMRPDQLAQAVKKLAPSILFWFKEYASLKDIELLVNKYRYPVAVEWQGLFENGDYTEDEADEDYGHYSIVTRVDEDKDEIVIVDPYKDFASQDRIFSYSEFLPRWWDTNELIDLKTGRKYLKKDERLLFIITLKSVTFPKELDLNMFE